MMHRTAKVLRWPLLFGK